MTEYLQIGILPLLVTLIAYQFGLTLQKKFKSPLCNPSLISVVIVLVFLSLTGTPYSQYKQGTAYISWLMTPATVCLAIPMYEQLQILKRNFPMMLVGIISGSVTCIAMVLVFAVVFRFDSVLLASLLPKSITSAIGVPLSEMAGGLASVTTAAIILSGIFASMLGTTFCKLYRLTNPVAQGVAFGTASHVVGTTKAAELSQLTGAVSSLSLTLAGLISVVILSFFAQFL